MIGKTVKFQTTISYRKRHMSRYHKQNIEGNNMLKYERGRVQTDSEYKLIILLIYYSEQ